MKRRLALGLPFLAGGCSILPDRPFIESQRFGLDPRRSGPPGTRTRQALLLRTMRAAPGLEARGLRRLLPDGRVSLAPYEEWLAPPAELAELALRQWLAASGRFTAVTAPGSRLATSLILETELLVLQIEQNSARAGLAALLLAQGVELGAPRPLGQATVESRLSLEGATIASAQAAAMQAALGLALADLESWIVSLI
jgi:ABC-type uncharacterized transport system auxiliary subunit